MKERLEKQLVFVMLFKEFLTESTFFRSKVEEFLVEKGTPELFCEHFSNHPSTTSELTADVDDDFFLSHVVAVDAGL